MTKEFRDYNAQSVRADENATEKIIEGHAVVFEQYANIGGRFYEVIERGAFDGCDLSDVALFVNHDDNALPLARTTSGTLQLSVDNFGLAIRARLDVDNNQDAQNLYSAVSRGDISGMSFAFTVADDGGEEWQNLESEMPIRHIKHFKKIYEVSCVTYPAYPQTNIQARADKLLTSARQRFKSNRKENRHAEDKSKMEELALRTSGNIFKDSKQGVSVVFPYDLFSQRAITISEASIAVPSYASKNVNPTFPVVSSLVDAVKHLRIMGGNTFVQSYILDIPVGNYTDETIASITTEPTFGYTTIDKTKITAYCELSEEMEKLPAADYAAVVFDCVQTSIKKVLSNEILYGEGTTNQQSRITGIFSSQASAIDPNTDISISNITDTTLDNILSAYGGDTIATDTPAVLILSKQDLMAFSKVRTSIRSKFYDISFDSGCSGTINGVHFIIDSACKAITSSDTQSGDYCMAYGNPQNYQLIEFSPLKVDKSIDYKFAQNMTAFRASGHFGGSVCHKNGFVRVKRT